MSNSPNHVPLKTDLEWLELRDELQAAREEDVKSLFPSYKRKWYIYADYVSNPVKFIFVALGGTVCGLSYAVHHFHNELKMFFGMSVRISAQLATACLFFYSYKKFEKERKHKHSVKGITSS